MGFNRCDTHSPSCFLNTHTRPHTYLVMAGLEGAPGAVESHLHRGEGQIGYKILATLRITVLHLEERAEVEQFSYPKSKYRKTSVNAQMTGAVKFSLRYSLVFLEVVGLRVNLACLIATRAFADNYPTPYRDGNGGKWVLRVCMWDCEGASKEVVMTSLATPHHWKVNSAGIPKCCAIRAVMTWCSTGTVCSWDPRAFGNAACLSALLLTGSHSEHLCVFACVYVPLCAYAFVWPTYCPGQLQAS